jgi:hypothetical protein
MVKGSGQGPERSESGAVVADTGTKQTRLLAPDVKLGRGGEDGIEMGTDGDRG